MPTNCGSPVSENRDKLERLAGALLEKETLDEEQAYAAAGVERTAASSRGAAGQAARSMG